MRRKAAISASQLDQPPVHDALRFFWSGLDLRKVVQQDLKYWPSRVGDGQLGLYRVPSASDFSKHYTLLGNSIVATGLSRYQDVSPKLWIGDGDKASTAGFTVEIMALCDWTVSPGGFIVGHTGAGTTPISFRGDSTNGLWIGLGDSSVALSTGPLDGAHCCTVTCTYNSKADDYTYRLYSDGYFVGESTENYYYYSGDSFRPNVALGALASHTRPLTEEEIGRNVRYYKSIWRD